MRFRSVNLRRSVFLLILAACHPPRVAPPLPPGEWTSTLGGPARAAYAHERLAAQPREDWRKSVDRGLATALQVHGSVILATTTGRAVVALDAETGMQYWSRRFSGPIAGTALRRNDIVYVVTGDRENRVHAIQVRRGRGLWSKRVGTTRVEPLLLDSLLVLAQEDGEVAAILASNGTPVWRSTLGAPPAVAPVAAAGQLFVATTRDTLSRMDPATGQVTARLALPSTASGPALVAGSHILLPLHSAQVIAIRVDGEPRIDWRADVGAVVLAPIAAVEGAFFTLNRDADIHRMDGSGAVSRIAQLGGAASGSFVAVGPHLVAGRLDGSLSCVDTAGQTVWEQKLGDSVIAPVAASQGVLYVPLLRGHVVRLR